MDRQKILKVILNVIFIPLIISFSIGVIGLIKDGFEYVLIAIIMDAILLLSYNKLKNKINSIEIKNSENNLLKNLKNNIMNKKIESKEKQILEQKKDYFTSEDYEKIANNLYINKNKKKIFINDNMYDFSDILGARIIKNGFERIIGSKIGDTNLGIGIKKQLINQLNIEIKVNDIEKPFYCISFLNLGIKLGFNTNSKKYKEAYERAQYCINILELIIKDNEKNTYLK